MGFHLNSGFQVRDNIPITITDSCPARKAFKHTSEFQVRDNVPITITDWWSVPATIKEKIWSNIKEKNEVSSWCRGHCEDCDVD
jgi:hypothetical protein